MKLHSSLKASFVALVAASALQAQEVKFPGSATAAPAPEAAPAAAPVAPASKYTEAQLLETLGWIVGSRTGLSQFGFTAEQVAAIAKGVAMSSNGKDAPYKLEEIGPEMDKFMQEKQQVLLSKLKQQGMAESAAFLTEIKKKAGVVALPSGLVYEVVQPGTGDFPKPTDTVRVHYTGTLVNGSVFDSSVQRGEPAEFPLDQVIPGWTEGIQKINKGGKLKLYVPPHLGYGDDGRPGIPPSSTLIFEVELLEINPPAAPAPAPAAK